MKQLLLSSLIAFAATTSWAQASVDVKDPWVRATVAQQKATGAFMQITSSSDVRIVEARSPIAGVVQIHEMSMDGGVMKMREVAGGLSLTAGKPVELKPGGYHVMLMDLKGQVKAGDVVPLTLVLEGKDGQRSTLDVKATARALGGGAAPAAGAQDHGKHKH
ncbi:copper chaperone PCu(A)C [Hydrogenophaga sp.]|uniref:copper chaperone PCu(A)C n=1 Tax=Hydrogenophaga sp. TaxID=1904254 RepID=UPI002625A9EB|nr:copper chaperone PCu(A)C [Hydrogenophaga sp.]MCW5653118.1 copper chaperone PCu(A)C [Hydrogenophaga sp.]